MTEMPFNPDAMLELTSTGVNLLSTWGLSVAGAIALLIV